MSLITKGAPLHPVDIVHRDRAAATEIDDEDGKPDRRLARRDRQHEHREHLANEIAEIGREGDEIDVHREQDQLDRHQDDDEVLAVQEDAEHTHGEQDRRDDEVVDETDRHSSTPCPTTGRVLRVASCGRRAF